MAPPSTSGLHQSTGAIKTGGLGDLHIILQVLQPGEDLMSKRGKQKALIHPPSDGFVAEPLLTPHLESYSSITLLKGWCRDR